MISSGCSPRGSYRIYSLALGFTSPHVDAQESFSPSIPPVPSMHMHRRHGPLLVGPCGYFSLQALVPPQMDNASADDLLHSCYLIAADACGICRRPTPKIENGTSEHTLRTQERFLACSLSACHPIALSLRFRRRDVYT